MARKKLSASETQQLNIGACKIMMARLQSAIEYHEGFVSPTYAHCGDTRDIAEQLAILIRRAEGGDSGDDYGTKILAGLGL